MIKKIPVVLTFTLFLTQIVLAQDLIVTKQNDSIHCKITKLKKGYIHFVFQKDNEYLSTLIPVAETASYQYNFDKNNPIPKDSLPWVVDYPKLRIAVSGGFSYDPSKFTNSITNDFSDYYNELRSGYHLESSISHFLDEKVGLGIKYSFFKTTNSLNGVVFVDRNGNNLTGTLADNISVSFVGPQFLLRLTNRTGKNAFLINSAIGYLSYKNNQLLVDPVKLSGSTVGFVSEIGYDIGIAENLALGVQVGLTASNIRKITIESGSITEKVKLPKNERPQGSGRIDFSLGLRYNL
ncbi:hypothetical protein [Flagellimonas onchidii]|uniref:hypothetical protein n=1 Tax=Flagellimonas onchidii TaxID=2562684 RepID=UPI0010A69487|nr:hypothetical protein [Allomuricauda onchidii]